VIDAAASLLRQQRRGLYRFGLPLSGCGQPQQAQFFSIELAHLAGLEVQNQRPVSHAANLLDVMADLFKHLPQLAIAAFDEPHLKPRIVAGADPLNARWRGAHPAFTGLALIDAHAFPQRVDQPLVRFTAHLYQVGLFHSRRGPRELVGEVAIVGHQQQTLAEIIEPPHGVKALVHLREELHHRGPAFGVAHRGHVTARLVEHKIARALRAVQQLSIHADVIARGIRLRSQCGHHLPVHLHAALGDHLFRVPPAGDARPRKNLLEPLQLRRRSRFMFLFGLFFRRAAARLPIALQLLVLIGAGRWLLPRLGFGLSLRFGLDAAFG
jgi:hypothetical protein